MIREFITDRRGAIATDWIVLSAGIVLLGMFVSYAVLFDSGGYLMAEFETLNEQELEAGMAGAATLAASTGSTSTGSVNTGRPAIQ